MAGDSAGTGRHEMADAAGLHREMLRVAAILYGGGAILVAMPLVLGEWELHDVRGVVAVSALAVLGSVVLVVVADRRPFARGTHDAVVAVGASLICLGVAAGGADAAAYGVLLVFVAAYVHFYFPPVRATGHVVAAGVAYAGALAVTDHDARLTTWILIVGASAVAGGLIGTLGHRVRRLYEEERRSRSALLELNAWRTTFLRTVAHDLRSPVATAVGLLTTLRERDLDQQQSDQVLDRALASCHRIETLVRDVLDLERLESGDLRPRLEPTPLADLVRDTVTSMGIDEHRRVVLEVEPVTVPVEASKIERIVENLVSNAHRHTPSRATIWVRVRRVADGAVLAVEDDGPGIDPADRDRLTAAFARGSGSTGGSGLGLHIVQRFTVLHGGTLRIGERPGGGARFEVRLPTG